MKAILLLMIISFHAAFGRISNDSAGTRADEIIPDLLQEPSEESDNSVLYDTIEELLSNPVNINNAELSELLRIPFMDISTADLILKHRKKFGHFFSVNELYSIDSLSKQIIDKISPFLTVGKKASYKGNTINKFFANSTFHLRSRLQDDIQDKMGFIENKFKGSKYKIYNRVLAGFNNFELGFLTDKDPGENLINDFSSYFLSIKKIGFISNIIVGDYLIKWGQGLALWSRYGFSKGADAVFPVKKNSKILSRYISSSENNFFRGAALNMEFKNFLITAFYSCNRLDANIDSVSHGILSMPADGLHRTENEIAKRKTALETVMGTALDYRNNHLNMGVLYYNSYFGNPFIPGSLYALKGNKFNYTSIYYDLFIKKINLFGELAYDGVSVASLNGIEIQVNKDFVILTTIRSYPRNFNSIHGFSFGEKSGDCNNEFGIYNGLRWSSPAGLINFYFDQFKFPYASYRMPMSSTGNEMLFDYKNKLIKNFEAGLRFKYENKEAVYNENKITRIGKKIKKISRVELKYKFSSQLRLKGRFEYNNIRINNSTEEGFLIFQDLQFHFSPVFNFYTRIVFFRTDSFNSAVYEYENDLAGTLLNPALFGEGIRWYFVIKIRPFKTVTVSCKYSETFKPKDKSLSSGLLEIEGNLDNRFSLQIDLSY